MDLVHMGTCSIHWGYTVEYGIHQNQAKPEGYWEDLA